MGNQAALPKEQELIARILDFKYDPEGFVDFAFPWGVPKSPLARFESMRTWQRREFRKIKKKLEENRFRIGMGLQPEPIYIAISSGRGPGKSAFLAMLDLWVMSCWWGGTSITTANTETQLRSRTMAELGKWHTMLINRHWFDKTSMSLRPAKWFAAHLENQLQIDTQYYYAEGQSWSEENPDAFAGAHSQIAMVLKFDEASGIADPIWTVSEGFFTDLAELRIWVAISNPRRNTGKFFDCFHKDASFWDTVYIDSRTVEGVDTSVYQRIADKYGEDHDVTRVEVKGMFPRTGSNQFIGRETVDDAVAREVVDDPGAPLLMGVDIARFGDDETVIRFRKGRDARSIPPYRYKGLDTMQVAAEVAALIDKFRPDAVFVDGGGVGGGVVDRLKQLGYRVIEVQSGSKAEDTEKHLNMRVQMWDEMRDWLVYGCIDGDDRLIDDLTGPEYKITDKGSIRLETKDEMKKRGLGSPNDGDALGLTFAQPIASIEVSRYRNIRSRGTAVSEYDIFG